jgi:hypothetical protein
MEVLVKTKKSEATKATEKAVNTRELILEMLEWDELTYGNFVMEKAEEYLNRQCGPDAYGLQALMESPIFWKWWKNHWMQRDEIFMYEWASFNGVQFLRDEYEFVHCAANLHIRPNRVILDDSYRVMIGDYITDTVKGGVKC